MPLPSQKMSLPPQACNKTQDNIEEKQVFKQKKNQSTKDVQIRQESLCYLLKPIIIQ